MIELVFASDSPPEWVEASETCADFGAEGIPTIDAAREFVAKGRRVDSQTWHYYGTIIDCVFEGRVAVDDVYWNFRAHFTGVGTIWRDEPSEPEFILCTQCEAWSRPEIGGEF